MQYDPKEFKKYPEMMSKEQLYKVCHVAKAPARKPSGRGMYL